MAAVTFSPSTTHTEARVSTKAYLDSRLANGGKNTSTASFVIPQIDLTRSFSGSSEDREAIATQIRDACTKTGFFYITGHGVPEPTRQKILNEGERLFKTLPPEKRDDIHVRHSKFMRGLETPGISHSNPDDWHDPDRVSESKEIFTWGYEDGLDPSHADGTFRELDGSRISDNIWPSEEDLPGFYASVSDYYAHVLALGRHLQRLFAMSMGLPETFFDDMSKQASNVGRLIYYPPSKNPKPLDSTQKDNEVGLGAHTDYVSFTILLCSATPGLELLSFHDTWVSAPSVPGSFIVNIGDFMMRWTNDVYRSTVHRVVNRTREERYSLPIFFGTNWDQNIEPLPNFVSSERPAKYPAVGAGEYIMERLRATKNEH